MAAWPRYAAAPLFGLSSPVHGYLLCKLLPTRSKVSEPSTVGARGMRKAEEAALRGYFSARRKMLERC